MLREAADRLLPLVGPERLAVVTAEASASDVRRILPEVPAENVLAEPLDLVLLQLRVVRHGHVGYFGAVREPVHADDHRFALLHAHLMFVCALRDLFLEEVRGDGMKLERAMRRQRASTLL